MPALQRRPAAILAADVVDYTLLMSRDQAGTIAAAVLDNLDLAIRLSPNDSRRWVFFDI